MEIDLQKLWYVTRYCGRKFSKKVQLMYHMVSMKNTKNVNNVPAPAEVWWSQFSADFLIKCAIACAEWVWRYAEEVYTFALIWPPQDVVKKKARPSLTLPPCRPIYKVAWKDLFLVLKDPIYPLNKGWRVYAGLSIYPQLCKSSNHR